MENQQKLQLKPKIEEKSPLKVIRRKQQKKSLKFDTARISQTSNQNPAVSSQPTENEFSQKGTSTTKLPKAIVSVNSLWMIADVLIAIFAITFSVLVIKTL